MSTHSLAYKRYVATLLLSVYVCSYVDRQMLALLLEPIRRELDLSDSQMGFLAGPAFILFYSTLGIPIARLADRSSRVNIISVSIAIWSGMTALCGLATNFWQLAMARVGVGVGEAGCTPAAQSLIADYFSKTERPRALSMYMLGIPLGVLVGYLLGGWINHAYGWRVAFRLVGLPGAVLALLMKLTIKEALRGQIDQEIFTAARHPPLPYVLTSLWRRRSLRHLVIAMTLANIVSYSTLAWLPTLLIRNHGMTTVELGTCLALVTGVGGGMGTWLGGYLTTRYGAQDERIQLRLLAAGVVLAVPILLIALLHPSKYVALMMLLPANSLLFFYYGPSLSLVHGLVPANARATTIAVVLFIMILFGGGIGGQVVGTLSDALRPYFGSGALRWAMALTSLIALWGATHFGLAARSIRQDMAESTGALPTPALIGK